MKCVYQAVNKESAENELLKLDEKWGEQYPVVIRSWQDNWEKLSEYFQYTPVIRKLIYTTNTVEDVYKRQVAATTVSGKSIVRKLSEIRFIKGSYRIKIVSLCPRNCDEKMKVSLRLDDLRFTIGITQANHKSCLLYTSRCV